MAQPTLPPDKTFRMVVKLVSTDGIDLPFKGFGLVPEERLNLLERVSAACAGRWRCCTGRESDSPPATNAEEPWRQSERIGKDMGHSTDSTSLNYLCPAKS